MSDPGSSTSAALNTAFRHALRFRAAESGESVAATASHATLLAQLDGPLPRTGTAAAQVIDDLVAAVEGGLHQVNGPRFFGWVMGGSLPGALAADWLTSAWDQNAGLFTVAPAASVVEEVAGRWLKELLRLPQEASFALVTGCQMAHVTCLAAARHRVLADREWDVERRGLAGAPPIRILTSTEVHHTVHRAARLLGLGLDSLQALPANDAGQIDESALRVALASDPDRPTIVLLQAGDLNVGAFDDFARLIPLAKEYRAWVHVDGAFGLWLRTNPRRRHLLDGVEAADSWATDGHKWLNVPYDCGYAFVRDAEAHRGAFALDAAYVQSVDQARDPFHWTPEWSRRARGFSTYAAIRELGATGIGQMVEDCCAHAHALVMGMGSLPGAEVLAEPQMNQGLVRFLDPAPDASDADHDQFTDVVTKRILAAGEALFSNTTWRGRRAMRVSVCNWQTTAADVRQVIASVKEVLAAARTEALQVRKAPLLA